MKNMSNGEILLLLVNIDSYEQCSRRCQILQYSPRSVFRLFSILVTTSYKADTTIEGGKIIINL